MSRRPLLAVAAGEQGSITITVALLVPVVIVFMAFVLVGAQWFEHRRHLQTQADAAALAAANDYAFPCTSAVVSKMHATVTAYGGGTYNPQVESNQANVHLLLNSRTYFGQTETDDTPVGDPCATLTVDVKATETNLENLMSIVGVSPTINAHARVELFRVTALSGLRPIGVPDPTPRSARAYFVDEADGTTIASTPLSRNGTDANGNPLWDNVAAPVGVTVGGRARIGVRIALGGGSSTVCGAPLVDCYDTGSANGLSFIQGWTADGSGAQTNEPKVRSVNLFSTSCPDAYFSVAANTCHVGVRAAVDFGTGYGQGATADPTASSSVGAKLIAVAGGQSYPLTYNAAAGPDKGTWTSSEVIPVAPGAGPIAISLDWEEQNGKVGSDNCKSGNGNKCTGRFTDVQRTFAGEESRSGPLQVVEVLEDNVAGANTLRRCDTTNTSCTRQLAVRISVRGSLTPAETAVEPPIALRIGDQNQTQALDCDPILASLTDELAEGCHPTYTINPGTVCPQKSALWSSAQPWSCMALSTGTKTNQIAAGLNQRILGDEKANACTHPNRYRVDFGQFDAADPRILLLAISPYGSFSGTGNDETVPVVNFATFYITGWKGSGGGFNNPCETNDIPADPQLRDDVPDSDSYVLGHFISYKTPEGAPSDSRCDASIVTPCVSVLTR